MKSKLFFDNDDITNPKGNNKLNAYGSFYFRDVYDCYVFQDARADLWYDEKFKFLGRVNSKKQSVVVSEADLKQLPNLEKTILVLPPVAESWKGMVEYINRGVFRGDMDPEDSLFSNLQAVRGWISPHKAYKNYNSALYNTFSGPFMNSVRDRKVKDFESFVSVYLDFFTRTGKTLPWTREGFMLSKFSDIAFTGMCIQIADADHADDKLKGRYLADKNFQYFKTVANRYGFMLDKNAPWRLIPDFNSRGMKRSMKKVGTKPETFYNDYFAKSYDWELQNFKHYLWGWYNSYVSANPYVQVIDLYNPTEEPVLMERERYTEEQLFSRYSDFYFLKLYIYIRACELSKDWSQGTFERIVHRAREVLRFQGLSKAMLYVHENMDPCSQKISTEIFNQKGLTKQTVDAILSQDKKKYKNPFNYY